MQVFAFEKIKSLIVSIRDKSVLVDRDVAGLYGVATKEVNQAVANNPDKFPEGYVFELSEEEKLEVVKKMTTLKT